MRFIYFFYTLRLGLNYYLYGIFILYFVNKTIGTKHLT
jgi:hypothetical protein